MLFGIALLITLSIAYIIKVISTGDWGLAALPKKKSMEQKPMTEWEKEHLRSC
mgnify:CR=1 FL=1|tara:strand:+ start:118 stop:276 length:159 start_codon:yes stop_codon:yes gene_type:complete